MTDTKLESISTDKGAAPADLSNVLAATNGTTSPDVEVKIGDKTVKVSPEIAAELDAVRKAAAAANTGSEALKAQLSELTATVNSLKPAPKNESKEPGMDVMLFTDPEKAVQKITDDILAAVRSENNKTSAQKQFWDEFYKDNKELKEFEPFVQFVFNRDLPAYTKANMTVGDSLKKLSDTVKGEVVKMRGKQPNSQKPAAEGGSERSGNSGKEGKSESTVSEGSPSTSTASILNERREARRNARQPGSKKA